MPNIKTNEMHTIMANNLKKAREHLANLQAQQRDIDEQIEDVMRVILGSERLIGALEPAMVTRVMPEFREDTAPEAFPDLDDMTDLEKELAIRSAV